VQSRNFTPINKTEGCRHWTLSQGHISTLFSILLLRKEIPSDLFLVGFPDEILYAFPFFPDARHAPPFLSSFH
jgi:hypothetical protein